MLNWTDAWTSQNQDVLDKSEYRLTPGTVFDSSKYNQPLHFVCTFSTFLLNLTSIFYSQCIHVSLAASYHVAKLSVDLFIWSRTHFLFLSILFIPAIVFSWNFCVHHILAENLLMAPHYLQSKSQTLIPGTAGPCSALNRFISHFSLYVNPSLQSKAWSLTIS